MDRMWISLVTLRVIWTAIGQLGYIHPDEFFQSTEIVAGDILNLKVEKTWEFDPNSPIRSIVPPYVICAPAMYIIRWLNPKEGSAMWHSISSQLLLVLPRLTVTVIGIFIDKMVYDMACKLGCCSPRACLMTFATSYLSLVYYTRTLSNTVEAFLFVLLLNTVISYWARICKFQSMVDNFGDATLCLDKNLDSQVCTSPGSVDAKKNTTNETSLKKKRKAKVDGKNSQDSPGKSIKARKGKFEGQCGSNQNIPKELITMYTVFISLIVVVGVFNRPTFPIFAAVPCILFMFCDRHQHGSLGKWLYTCVFKVFKMSAWISVTSMVIILCDSFYYGSISTADFDHLVENISHVHILAKKLTVAPWNFVKYNSNADNLAEHGLHPHYMHLLVNTPLLFGILAFFPLITLFNVFRSVHESKSQTGIKKSSRLQFLLCTYLVPILILSFFPHQEPRFLIPLLCPIALLYGHHMFDIGFKWYISLFWVIFNIFLCGLFYGALHQGGLVPSVFEVRERILREPTANYHVIFSHTYMPPRHLFQIPRPALNEESKIFRRDENKFKHPEVEVHDMKGASISSVHQQIKWIVQDKKPLENIRIFVVVPSSLDRYFCTVVKNGLLQIEYKLIMSFVPQITTEDPPDFINDVFSCTEPGNFCNWTCTNSVFDRLSYALSLNLFSVNTV